MQTLRISEECKPRPNIPLMQSAFSYLYTLKYLNCEVQSYKEIKKSENMFVCLIWVYFRLKECLSQDRTFQLCSQRSFTSILKILKCKAIKKSMYLCLFWWIDNTFCLLKISQFLVSPLKILVRSLFEWRSYLFLSLKAKHETETLNGL